MFEWLGEIVRAVLRFVPRISIIKTTHGGVAFVRGKNIREIRPGLFLWWPLVTEIALYPVVRQSLNLPTQVLTTTDSVTVIASGVVIYKVSDVRKALVEQWDMNETVRDLSQAALRNVVCSVSFAYLNDNRSKVEGRLKTALVKELEEYGIAVVDAKLTDFARTSVMALATTGIGAVATPVFGDYLDDAGNDQ